MVTGKVELTERITILCQQGWCKYHEVVKYQCRIFVISDLMGPAPEVDGPVFFLFESGFWLWLSTPTLTPKLFDSDSRLRPRLLNLLDSESDPWTCPTSTPTLQPTRLRLLTQIPDSDSGPWTYPTPTPKVEKILLISKLTPESESTPHRSNIALTMCVFSQIWFINR